jgi:hypothetical protein
MKTSPWIRLGSIAALAVLLVSTGGCPIHSPISREGFERIQIGMSEREVEKALGAPAGGHTTEKHYYELHCERWAGGMPAPTDLKGLEIRKWYNDEGLINVFFKEGRVVGAMYCKPK